MSYIGKQPVVGNFQKCDAISVVNGQAAYTLNVGGSAVTPENANHMLVSLNGVLQAPGDSFTVSGSTLTFASNLATGDVIDFVIILGDVLDLGTPSDNSISTAKLVANSVTAAKFNADVISGQTELAATPADTDELLISDAGVIKRIDFSHLKSSAGLTPLSTSNITSGVDNVTFSSPFSSTYDAYKLIFTGVTIATDNQNLQFQHIDSGGTTQTSNYYYANEGRRSDGGTTAGNDNSGAAIELTTNGIGNASDESVSGSIMFYKPLATDIHKIIQYETAYLFTNGQVDRIDGAGFWSGGTASMSGGFLIKSSSGQIDGGRFTLYGLAHS